MTRSLRGPSALTIQITAVTLLALGALAALAAPASADDGEDAGHHRIHDRQVWVLNDEGEAHRVETVPLGPGGFLGVETVPLTSELRAHFGAPEDAGVMISRLADDGPAARAGLAVGDVLTRFEGEAISGRWDLLREVRSHDPESDVTVEVWREGRPLELTVTLGGTERTALDLAPMFHWQSDSKEGSPGLHLERRLAAPLLQPEVMEELRDRLESMDWEGFATHFEQPDSEALEKRLEALEKRLHELEAELEETGGRR